MACCAVAAYVIMKMLSVHGTIKAHTNQITEDLQKSKTETCRLKIGGMTCPACVESIESTLAAIPGVKGATVSRFLSQAMIEFVPQDILVEKLILAIEDLGYEAERTVSAHNIATAIKKVDEERDRSIEQWQSALYGSCAFTLPLVGLGLLPSQVISLWGDWTQLIFSVLLCGIVVGLYGRQIHNEALLSLRSRRPDMSLLTSLGIILAFIGSIFDAVAAQNSVKSGGMYSASFDSTAILSCVIVGGRLLKATVVRKSASSLSSLANLMPQTVEILSSEGKGETSFAIDIDSLQIGDHVILSPGDIVPAEGILVDGQGNLTQTHLTGEILPKAVNTGDPVHAGSVSQDARLVVKVTRIGGLTWVQHMLQLIVDGEAKKSKIQNLADYLAARFVVFIFAVGLLSIVKARLVDGSYIVAFRQVTAILLCACPCALGLAAPTAAMIGLSTASKKNILISGGSQSIEAAARVKTILFDKTGTLTTGKLSVIHAELAPQWMTTDTRRKCWWTAVMMVERGLRHPIACAVVEEARRQLHEFESNATGTDGEFVSSTVAQITNVVGSGVVGDVQMHNVDCGGLRNLFRVVIGNRDFLESQGITGLPTYGQITTNVYSHKGETKYTNVLETCVAIDGVYSGMIVCLDQIRDDAAVAIRILKNRGYRVGMMTGGTSLVAQSVARAVGIHPDWVWSGLLPRDKLRVITKLQAQDGDVAMVGDNLNDIQSMTAANFSIAAFVDMNSLTAITADAILLADDSATPKSPQGLMKVPYLFELSKRTYKKILQNVLWALFYNTMAVMIGFGCLGSWGITLTPMYAGLGMSLSSVLVVTNAMKLDDT